MLFGQGSGRFLPGKGVEGEIFANPQTVRPVVRVLDEQAAPLVVVGQPRGSCKILECGVDGLSRNCAQHGDRIQKWDIVEVLHYRHV